MRRVMLSIDKINIGDELKDFKIKIFKQSIFYVVDRLFKEDCNFFSISLNLIDIDEINEGIKINDEYVDNLLCKIKLDENNYIIDFLRQHIELIECTMFVVHKVGGLPKIDGIIIVRSLLRKNNVCLDYLKYTYVDGFNMRINYLEKVDDIEKVYSNMFIDKNLKNFYFHIYSDIYRDFETIHRNNNVEHIEITTVMDKSIYDSIITFFSIAEFNQYYILKGKFSNIKGYCSKDKKLNAIHLIKIYLEINNYKINKGIIYKKMKNTYFSYEEKFNIMDFKRNFMIFYKDLKILFQNQLIGIDIESLFILNSDSIFNLLLNNSEILKNYISLDIDYIEFKDGIYSIKYDLFIEKKHVRKINCVHYCDLNYKSLMRREFFDELDENELRKDLSKLLHLNVLDYDIGLQVKKWYIEYLYNKGNKLESCSINEGLRYPRYLIPCLFAFNKNMVEVLDYNMHNLKEYNEDYRIYKLVIELNKIYFIGKKKELKEFINEFYDK